MIEIEKKVQELKKVKFYLPTKKVTIALISEKNNPVAKDPNEAAAYTKTYRSICVPIKPKTGELVNPLTKDEQEYLEQELGYDLNVNNPPEKNFYNSSNKKANLSFYKATRDPNSMNMELDLSDPYEYLLYKIALVSPNVCKEWSKRNNDALYDFVIKDTDSELAEELGWIEMQDKVDEYILSIKKNRKKLFDLLRLFGLKSVGRTITPDVSIDFMYAEIKKLSKEKKNLKALFDIISLSEVELESKILLTDAISLGFVMNLSGTFKGRDGGLIGYSEVEAIQYLNKPENQEVRLMINKLAKEKLSK